MKSGELPNEYCAKVVKICYKRDCRRCPFYESYCPDNYTLEAIDEAYKMLFGEDIILSDEEIVNLFI